MAATQRPTESRPARMLVRRSPWLAVALLAGGCAGPVDFSSVGQGLGSSLDSMWSPFMGPRNIVTSDALTVQRIRGGNPEVEPLTPEPGNVWPVTEAPRPTLMSGPDEAMRNIPSYTPSLIEGAPPATSPVATPGEPARRGRSRGTAGAPSEPLPLTQPPGSPVLPPPSASAGAAAPRPGQPLVDPTGRPAIGTGGTPRVQGFTQPGLGGGAVIRDGNVETWVGPDGRTSTRVVPN
ncbi:hypothetical protein [Falsiroseomonas sp. CW058]|uniref:hypothetical protein n=1 Tax=Falsiroseomonas sp. CW058 TaxID=3388664 RepID=UPI003D31CA8A